MFHFMQQTEASRKKRHSQHSTPPQLLTPMFKRERVIPDMYPRFDMRTTARRPRAMASSTKPRSRSVHPRLTVGIGFAESLRRSVVPLSYRKVPTFRPTTVGKPSRIPVRPPQTISRPRDYSTILPRRTFRRRRRTTEGNQPFVGLRRRRIRRISPLFRGSVVVSESSNLSSHNRRKALSHSSPPSSDDFPSKRLLNYPSSTNLPSTPKNKRRETGQRVKMWHEFLFTSCHLFTRYPVSHASSLAHSCHHHEVLSNLPRDFDAGIPPLVQPTKGGIPPLVQPTKGGIPPLVQPKVEYLRQNLEAWLHANNLTVQEFKRMHCFGLHEDSPSTVRSLITTDGTTKFPVKAGTLQQEVASARGSAPHPVAASSSSSPEQVPRIHPTS
ncbi:unnamed protein product [Cyprideis torosa]|uniref:Uncharacterized protein n=1 Tax=Cyprideis torosa TaxID=163714 RepID=A0A7R8WNX1_9CRUS|nr:unnamed protein product [Cyprideis torosa]CAG0900912.1 unnamed protein product [Cyprideis torosa]